MFNETKIRENKVCYLDGRAQALSDLLVKMRMLRRRTININELEEVVTIACVEYEKAWNKWADESKIGGSRYDEKGHQERR